MSVKTIDETWLLLTCSRCGIEETLQRLTYVKRINRDDPSADSCKDCAINDGRKHRRLGIKTDCNPHSGELDDNLRPIDKDFRLYRPGKRICGKSDCIKGTHILEGE